MRNKVVTARDAVAVIRDGDTLCTSGLVGSGTPDELIGALERRFVDTGSPRDLTLTFAAGQGDGKDKGLNRLAREGLLRRVIGGHFALAPKLGKLAIDGKAECYNLPQGIITHLLRDIAGGKPGTISKVGIGTFVDPRNGGGRVNEATAKDIVEVIDLKGEEYLFYKAFPVDVVFIRATTADPWGNLSCEREALPLDILTLAMAARNSEGMVIAQVERIARHGSIPSRDVVVPGTLVDCVVVAQPENHRQTYATVYSPSYSGEISVPLEDLDPMPLDARKVIARRCALELPPNGVVNLGIGIPEGVASVAAEEGFLDSITLTAESGAVGGVPASGGDFGASVNADAVIEQNQQFDFYDGGGLDLACLGMAECDPNGHVNVSRFGSRLAGAGGFINISQNARKLVFAGTFTAGGLQVAIEDGAVRIEQEGHARKFTKAVQQITFNGSIAAEHGPPVLYATERCAFRLTTEGLELAEVAPGIDVERDILANMDFEPIIRDPVRMNETIFRPGLMDLKATLLDLRLEDRVSYDPARNVLFANFQNLNVKTREDVGAIKTTLERKCIAAGRRVNLVVNYGAFRLDEDVAADYRAMVQYLEDTYYEKVMRYSTSAFMRMKLGNMIAREVAPHIFEARREAEAFARKVEARGPS